MARAGMSLIGFVTGTALALASGCALLGQSPREQPPVEGEDEVLSGTSPLELGEVPPPTGHRLLFEGRVPATSKDLLASMTPGVFLSLPPFPIELGDRRTRTNPLSLPPDVRRRIAGLDPEIRLWGTDHGIAVEHRGWEQAYVAMSRDSACAVLFDFRVGVVDTRLPGATFGQIDRPLEHVQVLVPPPAGRSGLYVLVIATVEVNTARFGDSFTESNDSIADERNGRNPPATNTVPSMERWFVVEHELTHAEQVRRAYRAVVDKIASDHRLCNPTRPVNQHKALVEQGFDNEWQSLTAGGAGGSHSHANYPNTPAETEARRAAWLLWDARAP